MGRPRTVGMGPSRTVVTDLPRTVETGLCLPVEAVQARTVETGTVVDYSVEEVSCCVVDLVQWMLH